MLIILEGPDGAGKSTLAQAIASYLGRTTSDKVEVWHADVPDRHPLDEYLRPLRAYRPGTGHHLILDRWHWGEAIYPKILERDTKLDAPAWWAIEAYLRRLGALVVLCDRRLRSEYLNVYRERGVFELDSVDAWQADHLAQIQLEFQRMVYRSALDTWNYRAGDHDVRRIVESARHYEVKYRPLNEFTTYLGPLRPTALLLGDVRNGRDPATSDDPDPAFVPRSGTSGYYLLRALTSLPSRSWRRALGLANACDVDNVAELYDVLGKPPVVALGRNAYAAALTRGIECSVVPHPQFVRRFHHKMHVEYGWLIYRASRTREDYSKWPQSSTPTTDVQPTSTS